MRLAIAFLLTLSTARSIGQECGREAGSGDIPILEYSNSTMLNFMDSGTTSQR
jgi:hypothetical protein